MVKTLLLGRGHRLEPWLGNQDPVAQSGQKKVGKLTLSSCPYTYTHTYTEPYQQIYRLLYFTPLLVYYIMISKTSLLLQWETLLNRESTGLSVMQKEFSSCGLINDLQLMFSLIPTTHFYNYFSILHWDQNFLTFHMRNKSEVFCT